MVNYEGKGSAIFKGTIPEGINPGSYEIKLKENNNLELNTVYNKVSTFNGLDNTGINVQIGELKTTVGNSTLKVNDEVKVAQRLMPY